MEGSIVDRLNVNEEETAETPWIKLGPIANVAKAF